MFTGCSNHKMAYESNCDAGIAFKKVKFNSLKDYDEQYVEISGTYMESKEQCTCNEVMFTDHSNKHALWVNFSQDCPLYLKGTRTHSQWRIRAYQ